MAGICSRPGITKIDVMSGHAKNSTVRSFTLLVHPEKEGGALYMVKGCAFLETTVKKFLKASKKALRFNEATVAPGVSFKRYVGTQAGTVEVRQGHIISWIHTASLKRIIKEIEQNY